MQIRIHNKESMHHHLTTCLWFTKEAEEAAHSYVKIFSEGGHSGKIGDIARYGKSGAEVSGQPEGAVMTIEFELDGNKFLGLNGGPMFKFSPATSFVINCETQEEIDHFWDKLGEDGEPSQCGWITADKYGIAWQIVPTILNKLMTGEKAEQVMKAMMTMTKLDIAKLEAAAK